MAQPLATPFSYFTDNNGAPLAGGKVYTYAAGTTTPQASYTDSTGVTPASNPVVLDSAGKATIWLSGYYKIVVTDANGVAYPDMGADNITAIGATGDMNTSVYDPNNIQEQLIGVAAVQSLSNKTLISPTLSGTPLSPTAALSVTTTQIATTAFVQTIVGNHVTGFIPSAISGSSTTSIVTIGIGKCSDSTNNFTLIGPGHSWAVANGNVINGYQGGTTLPNSSTIHFYECFGGSGYGSFASTSLTPTIPAGYTTYSRRVFSLLTNSSGALLPGVGIETEGGSLVFYYATSILDQNVSNLISASRTLFTVSTPSGIKTQHLGRYQTTNPTNTILITSPDETDVSVSAGGSVANPGFDIVLATGGTAMVQTPVITNTSSQIGARASAGTTSTFGIQTRGFKDFRR